MTRLVALLLVATTAACSPLFVDRPPEQVTSGVYPRCHESYGSPIADVALSLLFASSAIIAAEENDDEAVRPLVGIAALFALSAGLGTHWVSRCNQLRDQHRDVPVELPTRRSASRSRTPDL